jgi:hypothetical protein
VFIIRLIAVDRLDCISLLDRVKRSLLPPFSPCGRRGWGMRGIQCTIGTRSKPNPSRTPKCSINLNYTVVSIAENLRMPIEQILSASKHLPHQSPVLVALPPIDRLVASPVQFAASPLPPAQLPAPHVKIPAPHAAIPA